MFISQLRFVDHSMIIFMFQLKMTVSSRHPIYKLRTPLILASVYDGSLFCLFSYVFLGRFSIVYNVQCVVYQYIFCQFFEVFHSGEYTSVILTVNEFTTVQQYRHKFLRSQCWFKQFIHQGEYAVHDWASFLFKHTASHKEIIYFSLRSYIFSL